MFFNRTSLKHEQAAYNEVCQYFFEFSRQKCQKNIDGVFDDQKSAQSISKSD